MSARDTFFIEPVFIQTMESDAENEDSVLDYAFYNVECAYSYADREVSQSQRLGRRVFEAAAVLYAVVILGVIVQGYLLGTLLQWW